MEDMIKDDISDVNFNMDLSDVYPNRAKEVNIKDSQMEPVYAGPVPIKSMMQQVPPSLMTYAGPDVMNCNSTQTLRKHMNSNMCQNATAGDSANTKFCSSCGAGNPANAKFCYNCGMVV